MTICMLNDDDMTLNVGKYLSIMVHVTGDLSGRGRDAKDRRLTYQLITDTTPGQGTVQSSPPSREQ